MTPPEPEMISTTPLPCAPAWSATPPSASLATRVTAPGRPRLLSSSVTPPSEVIRMPPSRPLKRSPPIRSKAWNRTASFAALWLVATTLLSVELSTSSPLSVRSSAREVDCMSMPPSPESMSMPPLPCAALITTASGVPLVLSTETVSCTAARRAVLIAWMSMPPYPALTSTPPLGWEVTTRTASAASSPPSMTTEDCVASTRTSPTSPWGPYEVTTAP